MKDDPRLDGMEVDDVMQYSGSVSWGADKNEEQRPGVPQEFNPPRPMGNAHWASPERQSSEPAPLVGPGRHVTPVYSSLNPPRGISGLIRRAAYRYPDYYARRWMLLMLADRVDVIEHNPRRLAGVVASAAALGAGFAALRAFRRA